MNVRDRILAVVRGQETDLVPFAQYEMAGMPMAAELRDTYGEGRVGLMRWCAAHRTEAPNCSFETEHLEINGRKALITTLHTPEGSLTEERVFEPALESSAVRVHYVREPQDYRVLMAYFRDLRYYPAYDEIETVRKELGESGVPHVAVERTPYQQLWVQWVSLEDLCLHMADEPEVIEECTSLMAENQSKVFGIVKNAPIDYIVFPDNITAPAIGEKFFRKYCVPLYNELAEMLHEHENPVFVHMDGDLKPLWAAISESGVRGMDSLSPVPDNDTSVAAAALLWPDSRLWVNFPSSVHLAATKAIYDQACTILSEAGHTGRLQIQVSENPPPGAWRRSYPEILRAIDDFGKP